MLNRSPLKLATAISLAAAVAGQAFAHSFDERYDLPAPLLYFIVGATTAVALSFVVAVFFARAGEPTGESPKRMLAVGPLLRWLRHACAIFSLLVLATLIVAGFFGTRDPMMNLAPTLVWVLWWVGLSFICACIGNVWPALDPWRALFDALDGAARALGRRKGIVIGWPYPRWLDAWPAVGFLLFVGWFEVVYPEGAEPRRLAAAALAWTAITMAGYVFFGRYAWQRNADVFSIYFATLGRFAPLAAGPDSRSIEVRPPGAALVTSQLPSIAMIGFVVAMLATVLFDGLLSGEAWWAAQAQVMRAIPLLADPRSSVSGAIGLTVLWLLLLLSYALACRFAAAIGGIRSAGRLMGAFAFSLVPIAVGYNVAHNYSNLLVQGQHAIALVSDPLGLHWNLFGTARYRGNMSIVEARGTWYVAIASVVAGHVVSIWLAHRIALRELGTRHRAAIACVPLTVLMLIYTAISLAIIAQPMVKFGEPQQETMCGASVCSTSLLTPP